MSKTTDIKSNKKIFRIYVDTSVIGGYYDDEFLLDSRRLFNAVQKKQLVLIVSPVVIAELRPAPKEVRELLQTLPTSAVELLSENKEAIQLAKHYIDAKVVPASSMADATHVAYATIARADAIVSWNFHDIVRLDRIKGFNQVNFQNGYGVIHILSPKEVFTNEKEI